ncbi:hypothetical protein FXO38_05485 [Capsicum annuum]|nr:hypothetical protein FXO38_05485 [Capsicum annuum]
MAPFTASYRNFNTNACVWSAASSTSSCGGSKTDSVNNAQTWQTQELNANERNRLRWVQQKYMIYNYCADAKRFSQGFSPECKRSRQSQGNHMQLMSKEKGNKEQLVTLVPDKYSGNRNLNGKCSFIYTGKQKDQQIQPGFAAEHLKTSEARFNPTSLFCLQK